MQKKLIIALTVMVVFIYSTALSESTITFRNIPWLSSPATVSEIGFPDNEMAQLFLSDDFLVDLGTTESIDDLIYNRLGTTTPNCFKMAAIMDDGLSVAGYAVSYCTIVFVYDTDENGVIYSSPADTKLVAGVYSFGYMDDEHNIARSTDITEKLTGLYGVPTEKDDILTIWYDTDYNSITLYSYFGVTAIMYKYHDADELIKKVYETANIDAAGSPVGNVDGL